MLGGCFRRAYALLETFKEGQTVFRLDN